MLTVLEETNDFQAFKECNGTMSADMSPCLVSQDKCSTENLDRSSFLGTAHATVPAA